MTSSGTLSLRAGGLLAALVFITSMPHASAAVTYNFDGANTAFTATSDAVFAGPWVHSLTAGVGGSGGWTTDGQGPENQQPNTTRLTSPALTVEANGAVIVSFDHMYSFEAGGGNWDGGALFMSLNGGAVTHVGSAAFTSNGYNGAVLGNSASTLAGQQAFVGDSPSRGASTFLNSVANLGNFTAGDQIQVQFVAAYDTNTQGAFLPAWVVDNVTITGVIPEPASTVSLLGAGMLLALRRRRV
jgi:hypothetical protein